MTKVGGGMDLGLTCMGHAVRESGVGLAVSSGPIPNSYPLKFLASCAWNGGRILSQFENESSFVEMWGCVSSFGVVTRVHLLSTAFLGGGSPQRI
jgi:hypothetical protein